MVNVLRSKLSSGQEVPDTHNYVGLRLLEARAKAKVIADSVSNRHVAMLDKTIHTELAELFSLAKRRTTSTVEDGIDDVPDEMAVNSIGEREEDVVIAVESTELTNGKENESTTRTNGTENVSTVKAVGRTNGEENASTKRKTAKGNLCEYQDCRCKLRGTSIRRIPPRPSMPTPGAAEEARETQTVPNVSKERMITYYRKKFYREMFLDRCGICKDSEKEGLKICRRHRMETVRRSFEVKYVDQKTGKVVKKSYTRDFFVPVAVGPKWRAAPAKPSRGLGSDRQKTRFLQWATDTKNPHSQSNEMALQQLAELACLGGRNEMKCTVNETVQKAAGMAVHVESPERKRKGSATFSVQRKRRRVEPVVTPFERDSEVKRRTGFKTMFDLLAYVAVVCDGDPAKMRRTSSRLTWFEEWFLFFEVEWGRTLGRSEDLHPTYHADKNDLSFVFREKLKAAVEAVLRWPRYATHEEDKGLRSSHWGERYGDRRVVMWDNTNIDFQGKPSSADLQRLTYSNYYGGNVAKGGIFVQLCGWLGGWELWLGAVSDSDYLERSGILESQRIFMEWDFSSNIPFTNILDKGYRSVLATWRAGGQLLLQPSFAKSDEKFQSQEVLSSACVAADRAANERAVNRLKMSKYLAKGIHQRQDLALTADLWLAWGFQCNFMFAPVLD